MILFLAFQLMWLWWRGETMSQPYYKRRKKLDTRMEPAHDRWFGERPSQGELRDTFATTYIPVDDAAATHSFLCPPFFMGLKALDWINYFII